MTSIAPDARRRVLKRALRSRAHASMLQFSEEATCLTSIAPDARKRVLKRALRSRAHASML
ncbi:hypothetical protein [Longilinea arvoryzae]|uniref:hypothetical protein n=1 Tax=Longilinea arvoryzae TaxID=360412 RepID=UPI0012602085|nr:hypothetical protein [Longilinea arvoryzae]